MKNELQACIANPHWKACETCKYNGWVTAEGKNVGGCAFGRTIDVSAYLGDWIICDKYSPKEETP